MIGEESTLAGTKILRYKQSSKLVPQRRRMLNVRIVLRLASKEV